MFTLEKGDPDKLAGRALIYARCFNKEDVDRQSPIILGSFVASDAEGMTSIVKSYGAEVDGPVEMLESFHQEAKYNAAKFLGHMPNEVECSLMSFPTELHVFESDELDGDVGRMIDIQYGDYAKFTIHTATSLYFFAYLSQRRLNNKQDKPISTKPELKRFKGMERAELMTELTGIMSRILYNAEGGITDTRILDELRQRSEGSLFAGDVDKLCGVVAIDGDEPKRLSGLYIEKIFSIVREDFETAATLRDRIDKISLSS